MLSNFRALIAPLRRLLAWPFLKVGATPAAVGAVGILLAVSAAALARLGFLTSAFWVAGLAFLTDVADGEVARRTGSCSPEGNYLDAVGDRVSECLLLLGLLPYSPNLTAMVMAGACLTSYAKARCALVRVMDNSDWPGLGDYPDRAALIATAYLMLPDPALPLALLGLITWTCLWRRVRHARSLIRTAGPQELLPYLRGSDSYQR